jgi:hypothetical protein
VFAWFPSSREYIFGIIPVYIIMSFPQELNSLSLHYRETETMASPINSAEIRAMAGTA